MTRCNKVIHSFKVEIIDCESCPEMSVNTSNPYINLSEEERIKDLVDTFGILWAETCQKNSRQGKSNTVLIKY